MKRSVFFVSDRTGITAEMLGHSLLTQFEAIEFKQTNLPYIDTVEKAEQAVTWINQAARDDGCRPLLFSTLVNGDLREVIARSDALTLDFFDTFINPLEEELGVPSSHAVGRSHGMGVYHTYKARIDAVNFTLANDDGVSTGKYPEADIILVGVSRSGKTPTCLYLALHYGIHAANYPLTEEDLDSLRLPSPLQPYQSKLFALTIDPVRLQQIRSERRPNSRYASLSQCQREVRSAESIYRLQKIPHLDTSTVSIEEIATTIMHKAGLERRLHG